MVDRLGARGDGLAEVRGVRLYVPQSLPGERMMVKLTAPRADGWEVAPVALLEVAPDRVEPPCPHFGVCGGCAVQHLGDDSYVAWKTGLLRAALAREGLADAAPLAPLVRTAPGGRRRATLAAAKRGRRLWLGFNERSSARLVDVQTCPILAPPLSALIGPLRELLAALLPDGATVDVAMTMLDDGADVLLAGLPKPGLAELERLAAFAEGQDLARLSWSPGMGQPTEPVARRRTGRIGFGGVAVSPTPGAFLQASAAGEEALVAAAMRGADGADTVADLFAGSGTLTFPLSQRSNVVAVETDAEAIRCLTAGARSLPPGRVEVMRRDLFREPLTASELGGFGCAVIDPPRAGAAAQAAELARSTVPVVVALSCNPTSFARDARILVEGGYRMAEVVPVDQFLWSPHLEVAAIFRR